MTSVVVEVPLDMLASATEHLVHATLVMQAQWVESDFTVICPCGTCPTSTIHEPLGFALMVARDPILFCPN